MAESTGPGLLGLIRGIDRAIRQVDDMKTFANHETSVRVKVSTDDGRYYALRVERISEAEFRR